MLLISYHILYTFFYIYFSFSFMFMPSNTIEVDKRELYVLESTIIVLCLYVSEGTITVRDSDLYLYVPEGTITVRDNDLCMTQTGPL